MNATEQIFNSFKEGSNAIFLSGRSIYDLEYNESINKIQPIIEILKEKALNDHNLLVIRYTHATGIEIDMDSVSSSERQTIVKYLEDHEIMRINRTEPVTENEFQKIIRAIYRLISKDDNVVALKNKKTLHFLFLFEFAQHQLPGGLTSGYFTQEQMVSRELCYLLSNSLSLRKSGHYVIFNSVGEEEIDKLITSSLVSVRLAYPNIEEKEKFVKALQERYPVARLEENLTVGIVANLTSNTPNKSLEKLFLGSNISRNIINAEMISKQKQTDIENLSEGTLTLLDTERVKNVALRGRNVKPAIDFLIRCAEGVKSGNVYTPKNVLLVGAPASGKTDLALLTAVNAQMPAFQINSPKTSLVGETERKARLQMTLLKNMYPNLGFIDEVTEAFPMTRSNMNLDSGASAAVTAQLLNALSDKSRSGKSIIIAASNCPWKVGTAMLSRFTCIPLLMPLQEDLSDIVKSILITLNGKSINMITDDEIKNVSMIFWNKGASPRVIMGALSNALGIYGKLDSKALKFAAEDVCPQDHRDKMGAIFSDLWAIKVTASQSLLPWKYNNKYPFPEYIREVVDADGNIIASKLDEAIDRLEPYVNV